MTFIDKDRSQLDVRQSFGWVLIGVLLASFIAFFFSLQAGIFVLLFAAVAWWIWDNPEEGFLLFIVIAPLLPMLKITQTIGTFTLIKDVIILVLFARTIVVPLLTKKLPYRRNVLLAPLIALAIWSIFSAVRADALLLGILRLRDIGLYMILYMAILYLDHTPAIMKRRLVWFSYSFLIVLILGAWQWFFAQDSAVLRFDPARQIWIPRLSSALAHPSIFGQYLVAGASLFLSITAFTLNKKIRALFGIAFAICLPFIFLTYSRAVWIGLMAALGVMGLLYIVKLAANKTSKAALAKYSLGVALAAVVVLIMMIRFTPAGPFIRSIFDPTYASNEERLTFFIRLVAPITNSESIVGRGLGDVTEQNFREIDLEVYDIAEGDSRVVQLAKNRTLVDNQYLKTFVEMGVIGLVLFGWIYWRLAVQAIKNSLNNPQPIIAFWQIGFLAAFIIQALFIDIWDIFPTNAMFWILAAFTSQELNKD